MDSLILEWLNLALRFGHVIAAIMWIGDSFLFMWMDSSLEPPSRPREGNVAGEMWMVHSGGFYEVVKRRSLAPGEMPARLHWFKWQAYSTWITGFFLLGVFYYLGGGVYLIDPTQTPIGLGLAVALGLGVLVLGWLVYDALCASPLGRRPGLFAAIGLVLVIGIAYGLGRVFTGRAAYIHVGAMLGTIMAANVWRRIIPAQNQMLAATRAGTAPDPALGLRAKTRSTHNHYLTLPVLFTMLSSHFPSTYGHPHAWLVLALLMIVGMAVKHVMNVGLARQRWVTAAGAGCLVAAIALTAHPGDPGGTGMLAIPSGPPVSFPAVQSILDRRCVTCHAAHPSNPSFPVPPGGVVLEDPRRIRSLAPRILARAVVTRTMPLGNLTGMTEDERALLASWIAQGAPIRDAESGR